MNSILRVVNEAAQAYDGVIPEDGWKDPYMPLEELGTEIESGAGFYCWKEDNTLQGVMGIQQAKDTTLIRHSYILTQHQIRGIGGGLLEHPKGSAKTPEILLETRRATT